MENKTTMTPQSANAPEEDPSKRKDGFVCDKDAVEEIYPVIRAFVISRLGWQLGEDVTHETLEAILDGLQKIRGNKKRKFWAYCYRVARNKVNDALRTKYGNKAIPLDPLEIAQIIEAGIDHDDATGNTKADLEVLISVLAASKSTCREVLMNHFIADLDYEVMATFYDCSKDAVRMKIKRCLDDARGIAKKL
jgi:RNA polymerase sigma factor (sigma-70 family)